ncbi:zinc finger protein 22-like [Mercenaria mercenaria]|uniref:zinc finger protein 22-like n=1 Tax=Mercenaria mercenaria TaxID=6596 RepID=UPI00234E5C29|nr:zinc finger protein 22-like [Mercenaria mercenaria]
MSGLIAAYTTVHELEQLSSGLPKCPYTIINVQKMFVCALCAKEYKSKSGLIKHEKRHAGVGKHKCLQCGKRFKTQKDMQDHSRLEDSDGKYECDTCGSKYKKKSDLTEHVRKQSGEKPERCIECGKCFRFKNNLRRHLKTHAKGPQAGTSGM